MSPARSKYMPLLVVEDGGLATVSVVGESREKAFVASSEDYIESMWLTDDTGAVANLVEGLFKYEGAETSMIIGRLPKGTYTPHALSNVHGVFDGPPVHNPHEQKFWKLSEL